MFTETRAMFLYCTSPVHMGAGTAVGGLIDNPIQRERHTEHPMLAGSGLKGAARHRLWSALPEAERRLPDGDGRRPTTLIDRIFGPGKDMNASEFAGALSFTDALLVAFPVRSRRRTFVHATCATALARARRLLEQTGLALDWEIEADIEPGTCRVTNDAVLTEGRHLDLEAFQMQPRPREESANLARVSAWLAAHALPEAGAYGYFREKLRTDLVLLSDEDFGYFARHATVVEPHVRIDDVSGTADDRGLFYTENLPPETLLVALLMASAERSGRAHREGDPLPARRVADIVAGGTGPDDGAALPGLDGQILQVGGDATTGRGLLAVRVLGGGER